MFHSYIANQRILTELKQLSPNFRQIPPIILNQKKNEENSTNSRFLVQNVPNSDHESEKLQVRWQFYSTLYFRNIRKIVSTSDACKIAQKRRIRLSWIRATFLVPTSRVYQCLRSRFWDPKLGKMRKKFHPEPNWKMVSDNVTVTVRLWVCWSISLTPIKSIKTVNWLGKELMSALICVPKMWPTEYM